MRFLVALAAAFALTFLPVSPAQAAEEASELLGTWRGTSEGFQDGRYLTLELRWTVTKARGTSFIGAKSWRPVGAKKWSAPNRTTGVVSPSGDIRWVDDDGVFLGRIEEGGDIRGTYLEAAVGDQSALDHRLRKVR